MELSQMENLQGGLEVISCTYCGVALVAMGSGIGFLPGLLELYSCYRCVQSAN